MKCHQCGHIRSFHTAEIGCFFEGCSCPQYELNADGYGKLPLTRKEIEQWCFLTERLLNVTQELQFKTPAIRTALTHLVTSFRKQMYGKPVEE